MSSRITSSGADGTCSTVSTSSRNRISACDGSTVTGEDSASAGNSTGDDGSAASGKTGGGDAAAGTGSGRSVW